MTTTRTAHAMAGIYAPLKGKKWSDYCVILTHKDIEARLSLPFLLTGQSAESRFTLDFLAFICLFYNIKEST